MAVIIILKTYYLRIIIKNLTKCNIFSTFALRNYGKITDQILEKLCSRPLASSIPLLGLERVCPRKVAPWPWFQGFFSPLPWPRTMCFRLHLQ